MRKILGVNSYKDYKKTILTLGMFDGVHKGHKSIIQRLNLLAQEKNANSTLLTFNPHPRFLLQKNTDLKLLTLQIEKEQLLASLGLDYFIVQPFDYDFSQISAKIFVKDYLVEKLNVDTLLIGHDHHFGKNRQGDFTQLSEMAKDLNFNVMRLEAVLGNDLPVSSTKVRNALLEGDLDYANQSLEYNYFINGKVIHGDGIGKKLGFPTINLKVDKHKLIPKDGVYVTKVNFNHQPYFGLMSIGNRPTFNGQDKRLEVYILNFDGNLYTKEVRVEFLSFIRDQKKFNQKNDLISAIYKDVDVAKKIIKTYR